MQKSIFLLKMAPIFMYVFLNLATSSEMSTAGGT